MACVIEVYVDLNCSFAQFFFSDKYDIKFMLLKSVGKVFSSCWCNSETIFLNLGDKGNL